MHQRRVTAIVLNYNGRALLEVIMPSLAAQRYRDFATVVVDNGSRDDSRQYLAERWPDVQVIPIPRNVGVAAALNCGIRAARGEFVALLNNDVELDQNCLGELLDALARYPEAAVAATKLVDFYNRALLDGAGDVYEWTGVADRRGQGVRDVGQYDSPRAIFGACGGAALYRRTAVETIGPFDEQFFAFKEDVDWSFRAQLLGFTCRYVPSAIAFHMGSATLGRGPGDFTLYQNWRNGIWVVAKNYPAAALLRHGYRFVNAQRGTLRWARETGHFGVFLRAWFDALRGTPSIWRKRLRVQRSRKVSLRQLEEVIGET
jgi:GT2 family glycosyltransferase